MLLGQKSAYFFADKSPDISGSVSDFVCPRYSRTVITPLTKIYKFQQ